jgi:hypothetical protein
MEHQAGEPHARQRRSELHTFLLGMLDTHRHRPDLERRIAVGTLARDEGEARRRRGAVDALSVQSETNDQLVRHLDRANAGGVADAGPAVDEDEVINAAQILLHRLEQDAAAETRIETFPVERVNAHTVGGVLPSCRDEVERAATFELIGERNRVCEEVSIFVVPVGFRRLLGRPSCCCLRVPSSQPRN